jgi:hypothetical protein
MHTPKASQLGTEIYLKPDSQFAPGGASLHTVHLDSTRVSGVLDAMRPEKRSPAGSRKGKLTRTLDLTANAPPTRRWS